MYGRKLLRAILHFIHFHWFAPFRIAIHRRTHSTDRSSRRIIGCFHCDLGRHARGWAIPKLNGGLAGKIIELGDFPAMSYLNSDSNHVRTLAR